MSIDLYGGSLELYFKSKNGTPKTIRNIVFGESTNVHDVSYVNFVQSVRVKVSVLRMTEISVTLTPPYEEAVELIQSGVIGLGFSGEQKTGKSKGSSDPDLAPPSSSALNFNTLIVKLFYGGNESPYFKGILVPPEFDISTDGITITLKAVGMLFQQTKLSLKETFKDKTRLEIFKKAIGDGQDINVTVNPDDSKCQDAMSQVELLNANETNMSVIKKILDKTNCVLVDKGTLSPSGTPTYELVSKDHMRRKKDTPTIFTIWNQIDPNSGVYPIIDLKTTINNVLLGQSFGLNTVSIDTSTKKISDPQKENSALQNNSLTSIHSSPDGSQSGGNSDETLLKQVLSKHTPNRGEGHDLKDTILGALQSAVDTTLQYKLETVGLPHLLPGRSVTVKVGNIQFLSGTYDLYEVEHNFGTDGITTHLTLARTGGLAKMLDQGVEKAQAAVSAASSHNKQSTGIGVLGE